MYLLEACSLILLEHVRGVMTSSCPFSNFRSPQKVIDSPKCVCNRNPIQVLRGLKKMSIYNTSIKNAPLWRIGFLSIAAIKRNGQGRLTLGPLMTEIRIVDDDHLET